MHRRPNISTRTTETISHTGVAFFEEKWSNGDVDRYREVSLLLPDYTDVRRVGAHIFRGGTQVPYIYQEFIDHGDTSGVYQQASLMGKLIHVDGGIRHEAGKRTDIFHAMIDPQNREMDSLDFRTPENLIHVHREPRSNYYMFEFIDPSSGAKSTQIFDPNSTFLELNSDSFQFNHGDESLNWVFPLGDTFFNLSLPLYYKKESIARTRMVFAHGKPWEIPPKVAQLKDLGIYFDTVLG